jgi:hypothetical protein
MIPPPQGSAIHNLSGMLMKQETLDLIGHLGLKVRPLPHVEAPRFDYSQAIGRLARTILLRATFRWLASSESRTPLEMLAPGNP